MVQFLSIIFFFLNFFNFCRGFSKVPVFLCHPVHSPLSAIAAPGLYLKTLKRGLMPTVCLSSWVSSLRPLHVVFCAGLSMSLFTHPNFLVYAVSQTYLPARNKTNLQPYSASGTWSMHTNCKPLVL